MAGSVGVTNVLDKQKPFIQVVQYVSAKTDLKEYQRVFISEIMSNATPKKLSNHYMEGEVLTAFPCFQTKRGWSRKLILWNKNPDAANTRDTIPVFLKGPSRQECPNISEKDTIIILGAKLDACPSERFTFQVIADSTKANPKVWLIKASNSTSSCVKENVQHKKSHTGIIQAGAVAPFPANIPKLISQHPCRVEFYTKIADLKSNTSVNLYGVVKFFKSPFKSKGSDFCTTFSVVDPTISSLECSFKSVLFAKTKDKLPQVQSVGNIVRFHKIGIGQFGSELQGKTTAELSWLVFDGCPGAPFQPLASYPGSFTVTDLDKEIIQELRTWSSQHQTLKPAACDKVIADVSPNNQFFNLACQIIAKARTNNNSNSVVLTVFDGTTPHCEAVYPASVDEATKVTADESICCRAAGKMVDVFLHDNHAEGLTEALQPGDFVLLNNVHAVAAPLGQGQLLFESDTLPAVALAIHKGTICGRGVQRLAENDARFAALQKRLDSLPENPDSAKARKEGVAVSGKTASIIGQKEGGIEAEGNLMSTSNPLDARALQTSCTVTEHPYIPFSTIEHIRSSPAPSKFRCRAKALAYLPDNVKSFVQNCCHSCKVVLSESGLEDCPSCHQQTRGEYLFSLVLKDETGFLHAMLFHQDAERFLPELPLPGKFLEQTDHQEYAKQILTSLTQNPENLITQSEEATIDRERPWLECCIASYTVGGQGITSPRVMYRIFDTTCVID